MCNTSKKFSEKSSFHSEIIFVVFFIKKMKKNHFFVFSILKILGFRSFEVNFLTSVGKKSKKYFTTAF